MITVYVPRALVTAASLKAIEGHDKVDRVRISRGRVTDVVELDVAGEVSPEDEGEIRGALAALVARGPLDEVAELNRRVKSLEDELAALKGRK